MGWVQTADGGWGYEPDSTSAAWNDPLAQQAQPDGTLNSVTSQDVNQGVLAVKMPDGTIQQFPATTSNNGGEALNQALMAGGKPIDPNDPSQTKTLSVTQANGGWLVGGQPLNYVYGAGYLPGQEDALKALGGTPGGSFTGTTSGGNSLPPIDQFLNTGEAPIIPQINLPETPQISDTFSPEVQKQWTDMAQSILQGIGGFYDPTNPANANTWGSPNSQIDINAIPKVESNPGLDFLLSGKGYDDATLARMNAGAVDNAAMAGRSQAGSARLAAEQAGLAGSPAALALVSQAHRQQGDATTRAQNEIAINNAQQGIQNLTTGAGMANQNALANAAATFAGMQQNVNNVQQRNLAQSGAQSGLASALGQNYGAASLNLATQAPQFNAANQINQGNNQATLNQQRNMYNTGTAENRYSQALAAYMSLTNGTNPFSYNLGGAGMNPPPNLAPANLFQNTGTTLMQAGLPK